MAGLPDPRPHLSAADRAALEHVAAVRSEAEGRAAPGDVYVRLFNHPDVARAVGALGEQLRFHGVLTGRERELVILRFAARRRFGYEWAHHRHPAQLAGLDVPTVVALLDDAVPSSRLSALERALVAVVDHVVRDEEIPADIQAQVVAARGERGIVEVVVLCGLYGLIGGVVTSFGIPLEDGFAPAPFGPS
jgi:4-carboxymuconolactone decarboxylase